MTRTYKYRIYPNDEQAQQLARFFGCVRKMYNLCLDWWTEAYQLWKDNGTPFGKTPDYGVFAAMDRAGGDGMACAVGSLYMAGAVREALGLY